MLVIIPLHPGLFATKGYILDCKDFSNEVWGKETEVDLKLQWQLSRKSLKELEMIEEREIGVLWHSSIDWIQVYSGDSSCSVIERLTFHRSFNNSAHSQWSEEVSKLGRNDTMPLTILVVYQHLYGMLALLQCSFQEKEFLFLRTRFWDTQWD